MGKLLRLAVLLIVAVSCGPRAVGADGEGRSFTEDVFNATYFIEGFGGKRGTVFLIGCAKGMGYVPAFITARHVLDGISTDSAIVYFRKKLPDSTFKVVPFTVMIRDRGKPLYRVHPDTNIDLAGMRTLVPPEAESTLICFPPELFANEKDFSELEIAPGSTVFYLGYPQSRISQRKEHGFPILRSGTIASYPLLPLDKNPTFLVDGSVLPGNSGGPVYIGLGLELGSTLGYRGGKFLGIVSRYAPRPELTQSGDSILPNLGVVVHTGSISELLQLLDCGQ